MADPLFPFVDVDTDRSSVVNGNGSEGDDLSGIADQVIQSNSSANSPAINDNSVDGTDELWADDSSDVSAQRDAIRRVSSDNDARNDSSDNDARNDGHEEEDDENDAHARNDPAIEEAELIATGAFPVDLHENDDPDFEAAPGEIANIFDDDDDESDMDLGEDDDDDIDDEVVNDEGFQARRRQLFDELRTPRHRNDIMRRMLNAMMTAVRSIPEMVGVKGLENLFICVLGSL